MDKHHARHYADAAGQHQVMVLKNEPIARDTFRLQFACPAIARAVTPGQFLMLRLEGWDDPLIGRPLALYDVGHSQAGAPETVEVVYLVMGKMTSRLAKFTAGQSLQVWGPLGNGFPPQETDHLIMVAGGIGQTPFVALAKEHLGLQAYGTRSVTPVNRVTLCYGARSAEYLAGVADFEACGVEVHVSTDDGTAGHQGFVTDLLEEVLASSRGERTRVVCCGPEPMMHAVTKMVQQRHVPAQVSLETPMACGIGICFSCVAMIRDEEGRVDYHRTCVEGPVFDADRVDWA